MPNFTAGTSFTDGVTNDVTAAKLNALIADAVPTSSLSLNSTTGTISQFSSGTGTASSPAIQPTGDTNTGIFFPAADTIAFSEGGTESMRIDSSGNVGIGTTSPTSKLDIKSANAAGAMQLTATTGTNGSYANFINSSGAFIIGKDSSTGGNLVGAPYSSCLYSQGAYPMIFCTDSTERLRIDSNGNVGIGTVPSSWFSGIKSQQIGFSGAIAGNTAVNQIRFLNNVYYNTSGNPIYINNGIAQEYVQDISGNHIFSNASSGTAGNAATLTERLRITSAGEVYIAGTTDQGAYNLQVNGTGVWGAGAYVNGSDERLKENIQDITSGLDVVDKLRPVSFQYKENYTADRSVQSGFIAQDLLVALEGKNYLEGVVSQGPTYYNVAYQNLIPILAKAIQELKAENDSLKARITALEAA